MGFFLQIAWLIPIFPLLGFTIITLTPVRVSKAASGWLAIGLMVAATVVALGVGGAVFQGIHVTPDGAAEVGPLAAGERPAFPLPEGSAFEITLPPHFHLDEHPSFTIQWVDFYR